jgi:carboxymethylenebutenolidase
MSKMNISPKPVPPPELRQIALGMTLATPLSRRGIGPGLLLLVHNIASRLSVKDGIPSPLMKWAEEGFVGSGNT